ncbi:MAG: HAD-IA family hydrolase [Anaerolineales bacterium]|nr:HAD-IA family hydrolase [Anaerolineales bacterium]
MRALLLDLDDTLLQSNFDQFLPNYMQLISSELAPDDPAEDVIAHLTQATGAMMANLDPTRTLKAVFDSHFYPALGVEESELRPTIDRFYAETYPQLQSLTAPSPGAKQLVSAALDADLDVVVATNPLFPLTAIEQRLEWAGLADRIADFSIITAYESFHFAKPQPEYYVEIVGRLGIAPEEAAMIGDDLENDLLPARTLGMATFHTSESPADGHAGGDLDEARSWLEAQLDAEDQQPHTGPRSARAIIARLRGHLSSVLALTQDADGRWDERPSPSQWSPCEVICHLRDVELEVHQPRLRELLEDDMPFLSAADPDRWADERGYRKQDPRAALEAFRAARLETLATLTSLDDEDWAKPARHALLGPTTLGEVMAVAADHDLAHLEQLRMGTQPH